MKEKKNNKIKYLISMIVFLVILVISIVTIATNIQTTSSKIQLNKIGEKEINISIKPEEAKGITSFQIFLKVETEQESPFKQNEIENIEMNWNIGNNEKLELNKTQYNKQDKIFEIYVISKQELSTNGVINVGNLYIKTKNDNSMRIKMTPIQDKTYIISPINKSNSLNVLIDNNDDKIEFSIGKESVDNPDENKNNTSTNTNNNNESSNSNVNNNTNTQNTSNNTINNSSNSQDKQNNTNISNNIENKLNTNNNEIIKQWDNQSTKTLPKTGINGVSIIAIVISIIALIGIIYSAYRWRMETKK